MAHVGLAMAFQNPDIELAETEGEKLSTALQKVLRHYDVPAVSAQVTDWIGLIVCCGTIYGPRISASMMERKIKEREAAKAATDNVVEMTVVG